MLPAAPKTLGRLSDVFVSALGSITGKDNRLGFKSAQRVCVVLVDGLGAENLRAAAGHAPFLNAALKVSKSINTVFPSTTAAAITSFGVGAKPSEHGVFGYSVFDREAGQVRNLLSGWDNDFSPEDFQTIPSVSTIATDHGVRSFTVGPGEYEGSGFTRVNMSGAEYVAARSFDDRVLETAKILRTKTKSLTYLYFPELDSIAHSSGVASTEWLNKLEELDSAIKHLVSSLDKDSALILTADHGIVDVARENQILLDEIELAGLVAVTGDPRNAFLYFEPNIDLETTQRSLQERLGEAVIVANPDELYATGWLTTPVANQRFLPDLFLISQSTVAVYHRQFAKPQSLRMIGQHGGVSQTELLVPLLRFGAFAD
jgi:predicted AlkP superfamily pyrophosphatase or phosphodiesterase